MEKGAISISTGTIVRVFVIAIIFYGLFMVRDVALVLLTSVVIASAIEPFARRLERFSIPRIVSVLFLFMPLLAGIAALFYFFLPPLLDEAS
ncbi:hypothetical protein KW797_03205, partial [Candidatus Parcubacteria bacterium]|nr:hypothetical protein [Candidatus Parcubacteria bacterium]